MASSVQELQQKAKTCRREMVEMAYQCKTVAHIGGSLSALDMALAVYDRYIPNIKDPMRSKFVLSKGHVVLMQYVILAQYGVIAKEELATFKNIGTRLQGHPDINKVPETDMNTGLLGQGLAVAMGMAYARKLNKNPNRVFALCGDAELHEGQIWETLQQAAHYKLNNLTAIVDNNGLSSHDPVDEVINLGSLKDKFTAFGWEVISVADGNDMAQAVKALDALDAYKGSKPAVILMKTVKGKGIKALENNGDAHSYSFKDDSYQAAMADLK